MIGNSFARKSVRQQLLLQSIKINCSSSRQLVLPVDPRTAVAATPITKPKRFESHPTMIPVLTAKEMLWKGLELAGFDRRYTTANHKQLLVRFKAF